MTASGTVTVSGFLPEQWAFGARKVVDVQVKVNAGSAAVAVVAGSHRKAGRIVVADAEHGGGHRAPGDAHGRGWDDPPVVQEMQVLFSRAEA